MSDVRCRMSDVECRCLMSNFRCPMSDVWCPVSDVPYPTSNVWCPMSDLLCLIYDVRCPTSWCLIFDVRCLIFVCRYPTSDVRFLRSDVRCLLSDVWIIFGYGHLCWWSWNKSKIKLTWDNKLSTTYMTFSYLFFFFLTGLNFLTQLILITINEEEPAGRWIFVDLLLFIILKCHGQFLLFTKISCSYLRLYKVFHRKVRGILLLLISLRMASLLLIAS